MTTSGTAPFPGGRFVATRLAARAAVLAATVALAAPAPVALARPDGEPAAKVLRPLRDAFEKALERTSTAGDESAIQALAAYRTGLTASMRDLQANGDLEGCLAVKAELDRLATDPTVPAATPPEAGAAVALARSRYHRAVQDGALAKHRAVLDLAEAYAKTLETLKQDYTRKGRFEPATAARDDIERLRKLPAVTEAQFMLAEADSAPQLDAASSAAALACDGCNGTGRGLVDCKACRGSGKCSGCRGTGNRPSGLRGSRNVVMCVTCKGTGECKACGGRGRVPGLCPLCNGTGRVSSPPTAESAPAPAVSPFASKANAPAPVPTQPANEPVVMPPGQPPLEGADQIAAYVAAVRELRSRHAAGNCEERDFGDVMIHADAYVGRLVRSQVLLLSAQARQVRVAATPQAAKGTGSVLVPIDLAVGVKAERVSEAIGPGGRVTIVYGAANSRCLVLLDVTPSAPQRDASPFR